MKRNRYLLSFLLAGVLMYYAIPQLHFGAEGAEGLFPFVWIGFALLVIAGNLSALLYLPKKKSSSPKEEPTRKRSRSY